MFKIYSYDEPDSPSQGVVLKIYDEPDSPSKRGAFKIYDVSGFAK